MRRHSHIVGVLILTACTAVFAGETRPKEYKPTHDLAKEKILYCIGYAHLDTQWRWDFQTTIDEFVRDTLDHNFDRFEKYPGYTFNFTGSVRYEMMKEYYPEKYKTLKSYIDKGRWFVSGSSVDEGDVNVPSAEATIRQVLYGNQFFRREFDKESIDYMLPDCFGFPASMPSIWAHCGLKGFSTQKLTWGSAVGIPFKVGVWEGPDGHSIIAALDPGAYAGGVDGPLQTNEKWVKRVNDNGEKYGVWADYHYYGVGDQGGAPKEKDVKNYVESMNAKDGPIKVVLAASDQMYKDITSEQKDMLPRYKGDLLLTEHSAGTLTSESYMKRWNRKNELLADAAERAAVAADWLGAAAYPFDRLHLGWVRTLANQMHDILPGTSLPKAYTYSWNDEIVASNEFAGVLTDSVGAVSRALDTQVNGVALVVYNPITCEREDVVEASVTFVGPTNSVKVTGPDGKEVPSQIISRDANRVSLLFLAKVPAVSWSVFSVSPSKAAQAESSVLKVSDNRLENEHYVVSIDGDGNVSSIKDKNAGNRELLKAPATLEFTYERPANWPAWNMDWADRQKPVEDTLAGPAKVRVVENGPVRVAIEVEREARDSKFVQRIRLASGDAGRRVEFDNDIDWQSAECALRAAFPLTVANEVATYNWGMGTIERTNNNPVKYEVPSHEWFDLTDASGDYGVSILEDSKFGSDKPADDKVRLTLLYSPGVRDGYMDQHSQDWGRHDILYAVYGHAGNHVAGQSEWQGRRLNQPLRAFVASKHDGKLGSQFAFAKTSTPNVGIRAIKKAEDSDAYVVRVQEVAGTSGSAEIEFGAPIIAAYEADGQERRIGDAVIADGKIAMEMTPFLPRTFIFKLGQKAGIQMDEIKGKVVKLDYNVDSFSTDAAPGDGAFDSEGRSMPAEMLPDRMTVDGIRFQFGPTAAKANNAVICSGQTIELPGGPYNRVYLIAAADGDVDAKLTIGKSQHDWHVQSWTGFVGQWDVREWDEEFKKVDFTCKGHVTAIDKGYIKRDEIAWFATHRHHPEHGNEAYQFSYLFKYGFDLPDGAQAITLPDDPKIRVFAVTVAKNDNDAVTPAAPLYDDFSDREPIEFRHEYPAPPPVVFDGKDAIGMVDVDREDSFAKLKMGAPVEDDYADQGAGNGVDFRPYIKGGEWRPHGASGVKDGKFVRLNDGQVAQNNDDTSRCIWYDSEGRFFCDLGKDVSIDRINTYSWHVSNRAPQYFSLWGAKGKDMPSPEIKFGDTKDWDLIAVVDSRKLGEGKIHGSSISAKHGKLGPYHHLLWIAENMGMGTFFTEIDIHAAN
ncbi:MAG: alpha-mannosidase [Phycisphaerales bacterium]|nr:alpha-mannosidase [Phycisphaerales bacterium]MCB9856222.1 alpha-mannosidase [Phycisphaerales bacterium]MCB9863339.1 alpha-mannosidase [Phycisphaerales bacterium]